MNIIQTISPIDNSIYVERKYADSGSIEGTINNAKHAQKHWKILSLEHKINIINKFIDLLNHHKARLAKEITYQIGRPISQSPGEIDGAINRAKYLISIAESSLEDYYLPNDNPTNDNLIRKIKLSPVGIVFIIAPWNYPYLTAINTLIPALLAGNSVLIKHSSQTPLVSENIVNLLLEAGLPEHVCQYLHLTHSDTANIISNNHVNYVAFTGSNQGAKQITTALSNCLHHASFELGGKDAAYVKQDADLDYTVQNLVDGVYYNAGQSCCGVERIYVDQRIYEDFIDKFTACTNKLILGDPLDETTTLGPVVRKSAASFIRHQIDSACAQGAEKLIDKKNFRKDTNNSTYLAPQALINVNHKMDIMKQETFGPVVGIMPVDSDTQAISLINDSDYGLTCSLWSSDIEYAEKLFTNIEVGTCFLNKCDYLDPGLAWTGVKNTGYGCSLSKYGFLQVTRPKSYYLYKK